MQIPDSAYPFDYFDPPEYEFEDDDIGLINKMSQIDIMYESLFKEEDWG